MIRSGHLRIAWRTSLVGSLVALITLTSSSAVLAACVDVSYVSGRQEVTRSRVVPVSYPEAVTRTETSTSYEYRITGWRTAYLEQPRQVTRTGSYPVWDYYIVHFNRWAGGVVTSCVSWYDPPNCGNHSGPWRGHWNEYVWYVSYYQPYSYVETVVERVPYSEPVYELVPVTTTYVVTEWVTRTANVTEYYTVWEDVYSVRQECSDEPPADEPASTVVEQRYTLTYDSAGGSGQLPAPTSYPSGTTVSLVNADLRRDGHVFSGWVNSNGVRVTQVSLSRDTVVRAFWVPLSVSSHRLNYDTNGGVGAPPASTTHPDGTVVTLPGASGVTRNGYTFGGWSATRTGSPVASVTLRGDTTVYAVWRSVTVRPS